MKSPIQGRLFSSAHCSVMLSARELGGKGFNLCRLAEAGFPVPPFWVVPTAVYASVLTDRKGRIADILNRLDHTSREAIDEASSQIRSILCDPAIECRLRDEIGVEIEHVFDRGALYAVRSSVVGEDSAAHSFAGQMDSFLNVPAADIVNSILKVWTSAFSVRALTYRHRKHLSPSEVSTAVIIQTMIQSKVSGVLFTRDPQSGQRRCVVCAGYGLGEGVVADLVETDVYRFGLNDGEFTREISDKNSRIVWDRLNGGTCRSAVPLHMRRRAALADAQIRGLHALGRRAELSFGAPQDIEWAFDPQGRLYFLQTRPIVRAAQAAVAGARKVWDNSNIVESYPGITLPLTFSFARFCYEAAFRPIARRRALDFPPFRSPLRPRLHILKNMIALLDGRVYYNLLTWYELMTFLPGFKRFKKSWDRMIGVQEPLDLPAKQLPAFNGWCAGALTLWELLTVGRTARKFERYFNAVYSRFSRIDMTYATAEELIEVYESLVRDLAGEWSLTLDNDFAAMTYYETLRSLCARWGLSLAFPNLGNDLLCGERGVESVAPVRSLASIVAAIRADPCYGALFSEHGDREVWDRIVRAPELAPLRKVLEAHLAQYGDRGIGELKLDEPSFREQPELLIAMIRAHAAADNSFDPTGDRERRIRETAEMHVREHLNNPFKRAVFWFVLHQARRAVANRENMRFARTRTFGLVRRIFRCMGKLFAEQGVIRSGGDIHYLTVDEVLSFVQGTSVTRNLAGLVDLRKADYAEFARRTPGERIHTTGIPYLNELTAPAANGATGNSAKGIGCGSGIARGAARVVLDPRQPLDQNGLILIAPSTDPGWVFLMIRSNGIVVEKGSVLSHTAIIGRELGIPTVVGVPNATTLIPDGAMVFLNGGTGEVQWH